MHYNSLAAIHTSFQIKHSIETTLYVLYPQRLYTMANHVALKVINTTIKSTITFVLYSLFIIH